ncbi:aminodeoxychorismate/anthranilate synthase component II [bacterium]|nr:aminodeoxychorismate/anthranilate synthase component II [bacterium]
MILVIDNYDSFTYNLVQYLGELGADPVVHRNDAITIAAVKKRKPERIVLSPGPGRPEDAGICPALIREFQKRIPILGVCLGHQCLAQVHGATISRAERLLHGKTSQVIHDGKGVFRGVENPFEATRYHSLIVDKDTLGSDLTVTAWTADQEIMGLRHRTYPLHGVQFHPESILTTEGKRILQNFLEL